MKNIKNVLNALKNNKVSARELAQEAIAKAKKMKHLNAFVTLTEDLALKMADEADVRIAKGISLPLDGIPVAIKDVFCTKGIKTTAGSKMLSNFVPPYDAEVVTKLQNAGTPFIGKTNMDEFAMGSDNKTSYFGPVLSPWKDSNGEHVVPGGSSGGSAAAVAAGIVLGALGSDTGGSIRQPAAFCGIVGVKPSYERCSRYGMVDFASSLDEPGVFAKKVEDSAILLENICGYDAKDPKSSSIEVPKWSEQLQLGIRGMRIGIPDEYAVDGMNEEVLSSWKNGIAILEQAGAEIIPISLPHTKYALPTYYIIAPAEASSNLMRYDGVRFGWRTEEQVKDLNDLYVKTRTEAFGTEVKRRIILGTYVLSAGHHDEYYVKAQKVRSLVTNDFNQAFKKVDAILTPTTPTTAFSINSKFENPVDIYLNDVFTVTLNLAKLPGISVPIGVGQNGLPIGLQVIANRFDESTMFRVAKALEEGANYELPSFDVE